MNRHLYTCMLLVCLVGGLVLSCDTPDPLRTEPTGTLTLSFDNVVGSQNLMLGSATYRNATGEPFTVSKLTYFVSNFRLTRADGSEYVLPTDNNYYLIREDLPASQTLTLANVPEGSYKGIRFMIGVDSLRSLADISLRTGVLDPGQTSNDGMYWDWNTGYIFLKLEGTSAVAPATQNNEYFYHIGGFGGGYNGKKTINNLRTVTVSFNSDVVPVGPDRKPQVNLKTDVLAIFDGAANVSIAQKSGVMFEPYSATIADNLVKMVRYDRMVANP